MSSIMENDFFVSQMKRVGDNIEIGENSYLDESDELIHCSKCRGPMQSVIDIDGELIKVPRMCKCRKEQHDKQEVERARIKALDELERLRAASLMDDKFFASTFESYDLTKHNAWPLKLCRRYVDGFDEMLSKNQGLLLYGGVGTGKTHTAACIANGLMSRGVSVVMTSFVKILQSVQGARNDEDENALVGRLIRTKLLIIDDLGAERSTDFALEKVYNVVDSRYRSGRPMILTTNLTLEQMQDATHIRYSRIYDRVFEVCYPIEFTGPSWRQKEAIVRRRAMEKLFEEVE